MTAKKIEGLNPVFNQEMLLEYFHENLNHARHVENERMMFITLFTALVGGALGMVAEIDSILTSLVILCILFMLSIVCTVMTERWGNVFDAHMLMAQHLYLLLCGVPESSLMQDGMLRDRISNHPFINRFYIFNQSLYEEKNGIKRRFPYIHTCIWFLLFNVTLLSLLFLSIIYHALQFLI